MRKKALRERSKPKERPASAPDRLRWIPKFETVMALCLLAFIVALHIWVLRNAGALWRDEVSTLGAATVPSLSQLWATLRHESFPLLPYLLVRLWTGVGWMGSSDASLRVFGAVVGLALAAALWVSRRLLGYHAPLFSLVLFGLNPTLIVWGDSLRGYGLGCLSILLAYGLVWRVVQSPTPRWIALAAAVSILSVQCLYQNAFLLFAICAGGCVVCLRKSRWKTMLWVLAIGAASALSLVPYLPTIAASQGMTVAAQASFDFAHIREVFATALSPQGGFLLWSWYISVGLGILAGFYRIISKSSHPKNAEGTDLAIFALTIVVTSTVSFLLFLKRTGFTTEPWYYLVLMAAIAVSIDILMEPLATTNPVRLGRLAVVLAVAAAALPVDWTELADRHTNIDLIASSLQDRGAQGDFVVVNPWFYGVTFQRYYQGAASWTTAPPISELHLTRYDLLLKEMTKEHPLQPVLDRMGEALRSGNRVWVVGGLSAPPQGQLPASLPPAPNGPNGWYSGDYLVAWTMQLGHFIQSHATAGGEVQLEIIQPVSPYEDAPLWEFSGWRP